MAETENKEKGIFITWKHIGIIIVLLSMSFTFLSDSKTTENKVIDVANRQAKYTKRHNDLKDFTENEVATIKSEYWRNELKRAQDEKKLIIEEYQYRSKVAEKLHQLELKLEKLNK